jgi:hypothetical protein
LCQVKQEALDAGCRPDNGNQVVLVWVFCAFRVGKVSLDGSVRKYVRVFVLSAKEIDTFIVPESEGDFSLDDRIAFALTVLLMFRTGKRTTEHPSLMVLCPV